MFEYSLYFRSLIPFHILISIHQKHFPIPSFRSCNISFFWTSKFLNTPTVWPQFPIPPWPEAKSLLSKITFLNPNEIICFLYPFILYPQSKPIPIPSPLILKMTQIHFPPSLKNPSLNQTNVSFDTMTIPILILSHIPYPIHYPISHIHTLYPSPIPHPYPHPLPFLCHPTSVSFPNP